MRPVRHGLVACALVLATMVVTTLLLLETCVAHTADRIALAGPAMVVSRVNAGGWSAIPQSAAQAVATIPGVRSARARVWGVLPGPPAVTLIADPVHEAAEVTCGRGVVGAVVGQLLTLRALDGTSIPTRVKSVLGDGTDTLAFDVVYAPEALARCALLMDGTDATDIAVESVRAEEDEALVREIAAKLSYPVRVVTRAQMRGAWQTRAGISGSVRLVVLSPALLTVLLIAASLAVGGDASKSDAGKLKLAGWQTRDVAWLFAWQAVAVSFGSVGVGLVAAYVLVIPLGAAPLLGPVFGWTSALPQLALDTQGAAEVLLVVAALMILPIVAASLLPAWRVARTDPAQLLEAP